MDEIEVGDTIEIIENLEEEYGSLHEFRTGYQYKVNKICFGSDPNFDLYFLNDFNPHTGNIFEQGVYLNELKLIKKGK